MIGVDTAKDAFYSRLKIDEQGAGYCHFPMTYDDDWFQQATSEVVTPRWSRGHMHRQWFLPPGKRNEALDMRALAHAALLGRYANRKGGPNWQALAMQAERLAEQVSAPVDTPVKATARPYVEAPPAQPQPGIKQQAQGPTKPRKVVRRSSRFDFRR
jgi:phage terminase large subunit GpA-like protein